MAHAVARFVLGMIACLAALELLFRVLPVSTTTLTGYHFDPEILSYPANHEWRVATGWDLRNPQTLRSNNAGFVSERDFVRNPSAIALIGDSYIESSMLGAGDRPAAQLERALDGKRPVYAMGSPGSSLLDYAERIRFAQEQFGTRDFIVLMERGDVRQSLCGSGNIHSRCIDPQTLTPRTEKLAPPSLAKRALRHSALAQYLFSQLKVEPTRFLAQLFSAPSAPAGKPASDARALQQVDAIAAAFFQRAGPHVAGRLIIVIDGDRRGLPAGGIAHDPARERFMVLARTAGALVIDAEPIYRRHFSRSKLSLDVGPYDGHLNRLGVGLLAQTMAAALQGDAAQ